MTWEIEKVGHFWRVTHPNGINQFAFFHKWAAERFVESQPR